MYALLCDTRTCKSHRAPMKRKKWQTHIETFFPSGLLVRFEFILWRFSILNKMLNFLTFFSPPKLTVLFFTAHEWLRWKRQENHRGNFNKSWSYEDNGRQRRKMMFCQQNKKLHGRWRDKRQRFFSKTFFWTFS